MAEIPFEFHTIGFQFVPVPPDHLHITSGYNLSAADIFHVDDEGALTYPSPGYPAGHPVAMLVVAMARLWRYEREGREEDLHAAIRNVEYLMRKGVRRSEAVYYPYTFPWNLHQFVEAPMDVPWYSGMAQGYALMALTRLHRVTIDARYLTEAQAVLESFLQIRSDDPVWVTDMLDEGFVWFEEYPRNNGPSDVTYNGHLYAVFGLYEYFMHTGDERARLLADGGLTSILHVMPRWRAPGRFSWYCDTHREGAASYHGSHCAQLAYSYSITAHKAWARLLDVFLRDWPATVYAQPNSGPLVLQPGRHRAGKAAAYDIDEWFEIEITEPIELAWDVRLNEWTEMRTYIRSVDERYKFLLFAEEPGVAYVRGEVDNFRWPHQLALVPRASAPMIHAVERGVLRSVGTAEGDRWHATGCAAINGMRAYRIQAEDDQEHWIARDDVQIEGNVS